MAKEYEVLSIVEMLRPSDTHGVEKFYRHTIRTRAGTVLSVEISERDFTPEKAAPILAAAATTADKIKAL